MIRFFAAIFAFLLQTPPFGLPVGSVANPIYYIPYALHQSHSTTCVDGFGNTVSGAAEPDYDSLIGVANLTSSTQVARLRAYDQNGTLQLWTGVDHKDVTLAGGHSFQMSFLRPNPFTDSPNDWKGYATVESLNGGTFAVVSAIGGGGCFPNYWNTFSESVPVIPGALAARAVTNLGYQIPFLQDLNHNGTQSYRTGLVITNFDTQTVTYRLTYTVGDFYGLAGNTYVFTKTLTANHSTSFDEYTELLAVGYPATTNSEGWMKIEALNAQGALVSVKTGIYEAATDRDGKVFSFGYGY